MKRKTPPGYPLRAISHVEGYAQGARPAGIHRSLTMTQSIWRFIILKAVDNEEVTLVVKCNQCVVEMYVSEFKQAVLFQRFNTTVYAYRAHAFIRQKTKEIKLELTSLD